MPRLSGGIQVTRIVLVVLNVLFLIFGLALFSFGIYLTASQNFDVAFFEDVKVDVIGGKAIENIGITLIVVGIFTVFLSGLGCLGALFQDRRFLYIYIVVLGLIVLSELAIFITAMAMRVKIRDTYEENLLKIFKDAYVDNRTDVQNAIEKLESRFKCCGVHGSQDYVELNRTIVPSCYKKPETFEELYTTGCADAIINWILDELPIVGSIIGVTLVLEVFGFIASIFLVIAVSRSSYGKIHANL